jgi:PTS system mannose-specific IIA component
MIGIILVTHGNLAVEFISALEHVVGKQRDLRAITIEPDDDMEQRRRDILNAIKEVNTGNGVILLTDMFGGTPSNLAISALGTANIEVIAGVNLPMLVKLASIRDRLSLAEAIACTEEAGHKYIQVASKFLAEAKK